jgi:hypothetical protein
MRLGIVLAFVGMSLACAARRVAVFQVLPASPDYLLRSPDAKETPFPEVLGGYTNVGPGWVELRPQIELRVENAYFREGAPKHGLANFLGTEIVRYRMLPTGTLEQLTVESRLERRPADQPPVQELLGEAQRRYTHHRLFYQVLFNKKADTHNAVLLSASSVKELDGLTQELIREPGSVCGAGFPHCTVFPEACTTSLEIGIVVNGVPRTVPWTTTLAEVVGRNGQPKVFRPYLSRLAPVKIDPNDADSLRLPLLPGDHIEWR